MPSIFQRVKQGQQSTREADRAAYLSFLATVDIDNADDADAAKLADFMRRLSISVDQAEQDRRVVANVAAKLATLDDTADADQRHTKARGQFDRACAERQKLWAEINERVRRANNEQSAAADAKQRRAAALNELRAISLSDAILFGTLVPSHVAKLL